jgi:hypothetical protein
VPAQAVPTSNPDAVCETERVAAFKRKTEAKMSGVVCPVHGHPAKIFFHGATLREMNLSMRGCCERLIAIANKAIGAPL